MEIRGGFTLNQSWYEQHNDKESSHTTRLGQFCTVSTCCHRGQGVPRNTLNQTWRRHSRCVVCHAYLWEARLTLR
ncbi:hypothetical protein CMV_019228 [Castanea mollissima]|uniref:Uncharacterized protein n=1 Tax=Castanea mollissima TaxID=60419 RepID=A0A8J4QK52_9ROSI|nr:hypothetical protein CMV_019228 [Castanea mollissima]